MTTVSRPRLHMAKATALLLACCLALPLYAQEGTAPPSPPATTGEPAPTPAPAIPAEPSAAPIDPCADLRADVKRLTQSKTKKPGTRKKIKKTGKRKAKSSQKSPRTTKTAQTKASKTSRVATGKDTATCSGAMEMKAVLDILGTTKDLSGRNLNCLDFTGYDLKGVNFSGASMVQTNCSRANLEETNLERTNLTDANLSRATLHLARLAATTLTNAKLDGALWTDRRPCAPGSIGACRDTFQK